MMANYYPTSSGGQARFPQPVTSETVGSRFVEIPDTGISVQQPSLWDMVTEDVTQLGLKVRMGSVPNVYGTPFSAPEIPYVSTPLARGLWTAAALAVPELRPLDALWLAMQLYNASLATTDGGAKPMVGVPPSGTPGGGAEAPPGWSVVAQCDYTFGTPNTSIQRVGAVDPDVTCYVITAPDQPPGQDWGSLDPAVYWVKWFGPWVYHEAPNNYEAAATQTWQWDGITPKPPTLGEPGAAWYSPGSDGYPLGSPSWTPNKLASVAPDTATYTFAEPRPLSYWELPAFDHASKTERFPWLARQSGPSPSPRPRVRRLEKSEQISDQSKYALAQQLLRYGLAPQAIDQVLAGEQPSPQGYPQPLPVPVVDPSTGALGLYYPFIDTQVFPRFGQSPPIAPFRPPRKGVKEVKKRMPMWLIHLLTLSTYAGGTIRNMWQSIPDKCKTKTKSGKHTYQGMLSDVYRCIDQMNWAKFGVLEAEMAAKYAAEGWALAQMNRITPFVGGGPMFGLGTQVMHTTGGFSTHNPPMSGAGGAFQGRGNPFEIVDQAIGWVNAKVGITTVKGR